ncbi:hypothetical protein BX616_005812, partial [Lobosporangium transversale]
FFNMPTSEGLNSQPNLTGQAVPVSSTPTGSSSSSSAPPMMNMMMMPPLTGPPETIIPLFHPSEQKYFSEFLDTLVVDQDFTFDPSAIPNLPNLPLFPQDPAPGIGQEPGVGAGNGSGPGANCGMGGFGGLDGNSYGIATSSSIPGAPQPPELRHSVGTSMDFDVSYSMNGGQDPISVPAKRTKTNKLDTSTSPTRKGTPANDTASLSKISTPMSKLSLENTNGHRNGSSRTKKNKREQQVDYDEEEKNTMMGDHVQSGPNRQGRQHLSVSSTTLGATQSQARSQDSAYERKGSVSDDGASDSANGNTEASNKSNSKMTTDSTKASPTTATTSAAPTTKRKPYKELLTEEEKRANHIASEQKRRNTIRNGFKDMTEIIPDLKDVNSSKSTILFKAVDFIKHLERRNRNLQEKANLLEARLHSQKSAGMGSLSLQQQQLQPQQQQPPLSQTHHHHHQQQQFSHLTHPHSQHHLQQQSYQQQMDHHAHQQQSQHGHQHQSYLGSERLQEIPNIYPVAISR